MYTGRQKCLLTPQRGDCRMQTRWRKSYSSCIWDKSAGLSWMKKKKLKNSHLRSQRKRLWNLIIESFFVKVRCHVQKLLSFNVNKEICNQISFFFYVTYTSIAIFLALWKIYDFFFLLKMQTNRVNSRCLSNVTLS